MLKNLFKNFKMLRHEATHRFLVEGVTQMRLRQQIMSDCPGLKLDTGCIIVGYEKGRLVCGEKVRICSGTVLAFGDDFNGYGRIIIKDHAWIGQYNNLRASAQSDIHIGSHTLVSQFCTMVSSNHAFKAGVNIQDQLPDMSKSGVTIGDDVWLGAGVTVLPGVQLGDGCVVAANSVVNKSFDSLYIMAGSPARAQRKRE